MRQKWGVSKNISKRGSLNRRSLGCARDIKGTVTLPWKLVAVNTGPMTPSSDEKRRPLSSCVPRKRHRPLLSLLLEDLFNEPLLEMFRWAGLRACRLRNAIFAIIRQLGEQLLHSLLQLWMAQMWRYLSQRRQHKAALRQGGVRQRQLILGNNGIPQQQQIEVQGAWTVVDPLAAIAPKFLFDRQQSMEQWQRFQFRLQREYRIQEGGLIAISDGFGFIEGGARHHPTQPAEAIRSGGQEFLPVTQI